MKSILVAAFAGLASAAPSSLAPRGTFCGQWDSEVSGPYTIYVKHRMLLSSLSVVLLVADH